MSEALEGSPVPVLFPEAKRAQSSFEKIAAALAVDHSLYKKPVPDELDESLEWIISHLDSDDLLRGSDFAPEYLDTRQMDWLFSEGHYHLELLGSKARASKLGRLGGVIAMHSRRDEIATLITPEDIKKWQKTLGMPSFLPHVSRLLTHVNAPACEKFAVEVLRHKEFSKAIPGNIDGTEPFIFWTYAPYVMEQLEQKGGASDQSFADMMDNWCKKRKIVKDGDAMYPGIEHMYDKIKRYHYLGKDGKDATHAFVRFITQEAIMPALAGS